MVFLKRFNNKVVVVTGAAQGIGREVANCFAKEGAYLILIDRSDELKKVIPEVIKLGASGAEFILADLEKFSECSRALTFAHSFFNKIDVLVNNVGGAIRCKPFDEFSEEQISAEINRSLFPTLWCCNVASEFMKKQRFGNIVNVSSIATTGIFRVPYSAAKGGVNAVTRSLAMECAEYGIRVNATAPGGTDVGERVIPRNEDLIGSKEKVWYQNVVDQTIGSSFLKRFSNVSEQAAPILFLASDESSYLTGVILPVGGGDLG